jgi:integrase
MLCSDHLRPAAIAAGVLEEDQDVRFGFHTMRHSLASFLVGRGENPTVVQKLLRHSNVTTTLGLYSRAPNQDRLTAQDDKMAAFFAPILEQKAERGSEKG